LILASIVKSFCNTIDAESIDISSQSIEQVGITLDNAIIKKDVVVLTYFDVCRIADKQLIFTHRALYSRRVILLTCGYENRKYNDLHFHLSFPIWYWERSHNNLNFAPLSKNLEYGFSCINNRTSIDRFILGYHLYTNGFFNRMIFTQNLTETDYEHLEHDLYLFDVEKYYEYKRLLPIVLDEHKTLGEINFKFFENKEGWEIPFNHPAFANSYCFISVEAAIEEYPYTENVNLPFCSEKSFKAFITKQIPLNVGARGHYAFIKSLGFETMDDFLPPGYDDMPYLQKVDAIVQTVAKDKDYVKDYYFANIDKIKHNYELVHSKKVEQLIMQRINDIL